MEVRFLYKRMILGAVCALTLAAAVFADVEKRQGNFVVRLIESAGSFALRYDSGTGKPVSFLSANENGLSSFFAVKIDNTVYKLNRDSSVPCIAEETEGGVRFTYTVKGKAEIAIDFSFCPEFDGISRSVVKVDVTVGNISSKAQFVSVKGIFDTVLGESTGTHFSTARRSAVNAELDMETLASDKWLRSANEKYAVQFLVYGTEITVPLSVSVANKDVLSDTVWKPVIKTGRSFNSVFSYNNSAAGIFWNPISLTPMTRSSVRFYISLAAAGEVPADSRFLGEAESTDSHLNENDEVVYRDEHGTTYTVGALTDEQLDPAYIEDLLLRIRRLESDPESAEQIEILRLNAELDAILEKIRRLQ
ncbi:hypothetical protein [Treponema brennaborense]|uniref:Uncharacterized protein n=1 Tax=Treponema brennaborense (strain DSM 12168 / CIP 105900 / DD5/3) TaxID=906968 RepID=F4LQE1_TREBD|nr:hypothetical protein [Treponema brennaborense]AEE17150.1 hypothetical protein Trebr_1728 [Treponema brennaborense DSM 12168]